MKKRRHKPTPCFVQITGYGDILWKNHYGDIHREGDRPSTIRSDGSYEWKSNGVLHRENHKPAVIWADGKEFFYQNGHRYDPDAKQ